MITALNQELINQRIHRELCRSINQHGMWDDYLTYTMMWDCIHAELNEADNAIYRGDHDGEHGTFNELAQVAACCMKMMNQIIERGDVT